MQYASCSRASAGRRASGAAVLIGALAACSSDDATTVVEPVLAGEGEPSAPEGSPVGEQQAPPDTPLYVIATIVFSPEGQTSYLATTPSLDEGNRPDLAAAVELVGNRRLIGVDGSTTFWVADYSTPTIERWELTPDDGLRQTGTLSFANLGLSDSGQAFQGAFTLESGAFANNALNELIYWDPASMEIRGTLALEVPDSGGFPPFVRNVRARPDGTLLASYYYIDADGNLGNGAGVVAVDPNANRVVGRDQWSDCKYNVNAGQTSDGTTYFSAAASWVNNNLVYAVDNPAYVPPCTLRVLPAGSGYDRQFGSLNLGALVGREIAGSLEITSDEQAFFVAWHDELVDQELTPDNFAELSNTAAAWKWYSWDLASATASEVPDVEPFAGNPTLLHVDDKLFYGDTRLSSEDGGFGVSQYYELTPSGPRRAFSANGRVYGILRLR